MLLHDDILDNALAGIEATSPSLVTKLYVTDNSGSTQLCAAVTIDAGNFTGPAPGSPDGRQLTFATYASNPLTAVAIDVTGSADKIQLATAGSQVQVEADITSAPKAVSSGDTVNIGSFTITFRDAA